MPNRSENQSIFLGPSGNVRSFNESLSTFPYPGMVGQTMRIDDKWYQLVQFATSTVQPIAGGMAYWLSQTLNLSQPAPYQVTMNPEFSVGGNVIYSNTPAGIIVGAPTAGNLGFIQKSGITICPVWSCSIVRQGDQAIAVSQGVANVTCGAFITAGLTPDVVRVGVFRTSAVATTAAAYLDLTLRNFEL